MENETAVYTYYLNPDTHLLTVYENGLVLSTVQGVSEDMANEIFLEDVYNIAGVELE